MTEKGFILNIDNVNFIKNYKFEVIDGRLYPEYLYKYIKVFVDFKRFDILDYLSDDALDMDTVKYILRKIDNIYKYTKILCNTYDKVLYYYKYCSKHDEEPFIYYLNLSIENNLKKIDIELLKWRLSKSNIIPMEHLKKLIMDYDMAVLLSKHCIKIFNLYKDKNPNCTIEELKGLIDIYLDSYINNFESSDIIFHNEELVIYLMDKGVNNAYDYYQEYCINNNINISEDLVKYAIDKRYLNISPQFITLNIIDYIIEKYNIGDSSFHDLIQYIINEKLEYLNDKQIIKIRYATDNPVIEKRVDELFDALDNYKENNIISKELLNITDDLYLLELMMNKQDTNDDKMYTKYEYIKTYLMYDFFVGVGDVNDTINTYSLAYSLGKADRPIDTELFTLALSKGYRMTRRNFKGVHQDIVMNRDLVYTYLVYLANLSMFDKYLELGGIPDIELSKKAIMCMDDVDIKEQLYRVMFKDREHVKELLTIYPLVIDEYYYINNDIDDELIRSAINNGYKITYNSPIVIKGNIEYIKLCIENIIINPEYHDKKQNIQDVMKAYNSYLLELKKLPVNENKEIIKEIIDLCLKYQIEFNDFLIIDSYEKCEYILDNADYRVKSIVNCYEYNLEKYNLNDTKPDFNLWLKQIYINKSLDFNFNKLSKQENEILMLFSLYLETFEHRYIKDINQLPFYVTKDGFTVNFYSMFVTNEYELMFEVLRHNADKISNVPDLVAQFFTPYLEKEYSKEKVDYLIKELGNNLLIVDFRRYLSLDIEVLKKAISLFKIEPFSFNEFNDKIYDSLKQEEFGRRYPFFQQVYSYISQAIELNNIDEINRFKYMAKTILIDYRKSEEEINELELKIDKLIEYSIEKYKNGDINPLHLLCNKITRLSREIYRKDQNDILDDLDFPLDDKDYKKKSTLFVLDEINIHTLSDTNFSFEEIEIMKSIIRHDKSLTIDIYKKYGPRLEEFYNDVYINIVSKKETGFDALVDQQFKVKRKKELPLVNYDVLNELSMFTAEELKELVMDDKFYNNLFYHLHYYKIPRIPNIDKFINNGLMIEGSFDFTNLWNFIIFYREFLLKQLSNINSTNKENFTISDLRFSFADLFNYFIAVNKELKEYRLLFGKEDYDLLVMEPGAFKSGYNNTKKLLILSKYIKYLYTIGITIPSYDKNIEYNGKMINVIVGNRSNMCNFTHGERTNACMRCGGIGDSLFEFCLTNPNGFHIRFEEPDTHEYISRVSGFRNGNTVFLNQLRHSCNKNLYSSEELVEYIKIVANELIELSRNSGCPIENVFISGGYAMSLSKDSVINIHLTNIKEGLGDFYSDIRSNNIIVLSSSNNEVSLDNTNVPIYKPVRDKVYGIEIGIDKLLDKINIVSSNKKYLISKSMSGIEEITDIMDGYVGTDFYVYIDDFDNIYYDFFDMVDYHDKDTSYEEMIKYKEILMNKYNISEKRY